MAKLSSRRLLVGLMALSVCAPAKASELFEQIGGWDVTVEDDGSCQALIVYEQVKEGFGFRLNAQTGTVIVGISSKEATSLKPKDVVDLDVYFSTHDRRSNSGDDWAGVKFVAHEGQRPLPTKMLFSEPLREEILDDIAKYEGVIFVFGGKLVQGYDLTNTQRVVASVRGCARKVAGRNPNDPFRQ